MSVVLLHGLTGNGATWGPVVRGLGEVLTPDLHGPSYDDLADRVAALIGSSRPVIVGHSMGGMVATVVASRGLTSGVVLVDPTFLSVERQHEVYASDVADQHRRLLQMTKAEVIADLRARHPRRSLEVIELQADARLATPVEAFEILAPPLPDYRELVRSITVPILLVIGDNPVVTPEMAAELYTINPRVRVEQIANAGHGVPFDQPERLGELIAAFLAPSA